MGNIYAPVANLPLTKPPRGVHFTNIKGCSFNKGLRLDPDKFYLFFSSKENQVPLPPAGFYDVPDLGKIVYIKEFKPYMRSEYRTITISEQITLDPAAAGELHKWRVFVFRAFEGDPPKDFVPDKNFDYKRASIEKLGWGTQ